MNILFVHSHLNIGGIETLILRISRALSAQGHSVSVVIREVGDASLMKAVSRYAPVYVLPRGPVSRGANNEPAWAEFDVLYGFDAGAIPDILTISKIGGFKAKVVVGAYHPQGYCYQKINLRVLKRLVRWVGTRIPEENFVFMNDAVRLSHERSIRRSFDNAPIVPLPVDIERFQNFERSPIPNQIVSVGRLVDFKTYNAHMIGVMAELRQTGHSFEYHIYGEGPDKGKLTSLAEEHGVSDIVHFHGSIDYGQLEEAFKHAFVFVGMGTSLIEAAAAGVPSLVAIESNQVSTTYGLFSKTSGYQVGEFIPGSPELLLRGEIISIARMSDEDYKTTGDEHKERAIPFATTEVTSRFVQALSQASCFNPRVPMIAIRLHWLELTVRRVGRSLAIAGGWSPKKRSRYMRDEQSATRVQRTPPTDYPRRSQ